jgi:hypothetical protein
MNLDETLDTLKHLSAIDRAAALNHLLFCEVAKEVGWANRLSSTWDGLTDSEKNFNRAIIQKLIDNPVILDFLGKFLAEARNSTG